MKVTRNFDFNKLVQSNAISLWLNEYGNKINRSIQEGLDTSTDITGTGFESVSDFTSNSIHDGQAHKKPLVRSGRLKKSVKKFPATANKLTFIIKSNVKSKARWNIEVDGKKYSGTRKSRDINYGAVHNRGPHKTSKDSFIPNQTVRMRNWFGIPSKFLVGGLEWKITRDRLDYYLRYGVKAPMKEYK